MTAASSFTVKPVTTARLPDLAALFGTNRTTSGCYCMWFLLPAKECQAGWGGGNKQAFEALAPTQRQPLGLLAYRDGDPVGWCAVGPRSRYARALRSPVLRDRDPTDDDTTWLLPCFYVRRDARRQGLTRLLVDTAVEVARKRGATAVEAFPLAGDRRRSTGEAFVGVEPLFASCGFSVIARPTTGRAVMRRVLRP